MPGRFRPLTALLLVPAVPLLIAAGFGAGWLVSGGAPSLSPSVASAPQPTLPATAATPAPTPTPAPVRPAPVHKATPPPLLPPPPAPVHAAPLPPPPGPTTSVGTITAGGRVRQYLVYAPAGAAASSTPILVVLHGVAATAQLEAQRDDLLPLWNSGQAELVYPMGVGNSWNAGGCCGVAAADGVDDVDFLRALIPALDPGHARPIYLIGYSNGGRMVYTMVCDAPGLVNGFGVVNAVPVQACANPQPATVLQIAGTADPEVAYQPGDHGDEFVPVTTQVAALRSADGCPSTAETGSQGQMTMTVWSCGDGTRVEFASYAGGTHAWPIGNATTPGAPRVIWTFLVDNAW